MAAPWTAIVLAGGRGQRLGHLEKPQVRIGDRTLLDTVIAGLPDEVAVIVVGPQTVTRRAVDFCLEEPRFGGPVAGIAAALPRVRTPLVALLASDMPNAGSFVGRLIEDFDPDGDVDALVPVDLEGRRQPLCSVVRAASLRRALDALEATTDASMRALLSHLCVAERQLGRSEANVVVDVDTFTDLDRLRGSTGQS